MIIMSTKSKYLKYRSDFVNGGGYGARTCDFHLVTMAL